VLGLLGQRRQVVGEVLALDGRLELLRGAAGFAAFLGVPEVDGRGTAAQPHDDDGLRRPRGGVLRQEQVGHRGAEELRLLREREAEEAAEARAEHVAPGHPVTRGPFAILAVVRHVITPVYLSCKPRGRGKVAEIRNQWLNRNSLEFRSTQKTSS